MAKHKLLRLQKNNSFARQHISGCFKKTHIAMAVCSALLTPLTVYALPLANDLPTGGLVTTGAATIQQNGNALTIHQSSQQANLTWQSFNIGSDASVTFVQPSAAALAVNRIYDVNGSEILGRLNANGQVWLINPNGILFGHGAQVNVGGLVAATLESVGENRFAGDSLAAVTNLGEIQAGYVAFLGQSVTNEGTIRTKLGTTALGAGNDVSLHFANDALLGLTVNQNQLAALAANGGIIQANGGSVLLSAGAKNSLLASQVNNTGTIEAQTLGIKEGKIILLSGMESGTTRVGGVLDASASTGNGGFVETSGATVAVTDAARITTLSANGTTGLWLIDPKDYTIAVSGGDITAATLATQLTASNVTIESSSGATNGNGDINVNEAISWTGSNALTLKASRNINVNQAINGVGALILNAAVTSGGDAAVTSGRINLRADITTGGAQTYNGNVAVENNIDLNASGNIGFLKKIEGSATSDLSIVTQGAVNFSDTVGSSTALSKLDVDATNGAVVTGNVTTTNDQVWKKSALLAKDTLFKSNAGNISFLGKIDNASTTAFAASLQATNISLNDVVGGGSNGALASFSVLGQLSLAAGTVTTEGNQSYSAAVLLGKNTALHTTDGGNITFDSTIDGAYKLALTTDKLLNASNEITNPDTKISIAGAVGATSALTELEAESVKAIVLNGAVTTTGIQHYKSTVSLGSDVTLSTTNAAVTFDSAVGNLAPTDHHDLTISTGTGAITLSGGLGLGSNETETEFTMEDVLGSVTLTATGDINLSQVRAESLSVGSGLTKLKGSVVTKNQQDYQGVVQVAADDIVLMTQNAADINFQSTIDGTNNLTLTSGKTVNFGGAIGATTALKSLTVTAATGITLNVGVTTQGDQLYHSPTTLGADVSLTSTQDGDVIFDNAIDGAHALTVTAAGAAKFFQVGASSALTGLDITAADGIYIRDQLKTSGAQTYSSHVFLDADTTLLSQNAVITLSDKVDNSSSTARKLTIDAGTAAADLSAAVGSTNGAISGLNVNASAIHIGSSLAIGSGGLTLTSTSANITQSSAFNIAGAVQIDAGLHDITLTNAGNQFLSELTLKGIQVALVNDHATTLGGSQIKGDLSIVTNGALTQTAALQVEGDVTLTQNSTVAGSSQDIQLSQANNLLKKTVTLASGTGAAIHHVSLTNNYAAPGVLTLPAQVTGDLLLSYGNAPLQVGSWPQIGGNLELWAPAGIILNGNISSGGSQVFHNNVRLDGNVALTTTNAGIDFQAKLDNANTSASNLTLSTGTGAINFAQAVGTGANGALGNVVLQGSGVVHLPVMQMASLSTDSGQTVRLNGDLTSADNLSFGGSTWLDDDVNLTAKNIAFLGQLNGNNDLVINANQTVNFANSVGAQTALASLDIASASSIAVAGDITTLEGQSFGADIALSANSTWQAGDDIFLKGTLNGAHQLVLNSAGKLRIEKDVGATTALTSVDATAAQGIDIFANVATTGAQQWRSALNLNADINLSSTTDSLHFFSAINGARGLTVSAGDQAIFDTPVGAAAALDRLSVTAVNKISLNGNVSTLGAQQYQGKVWLNQDALLKSSVIGDIALGSVDGGRNFSVNTAGTVSLGGLGASTALNSVDITAAAIQLNGNVASSETQRYGANVALNQDVTLTTSGTGNVIFGGAIDGAHQLLIDAKGKASVAGLIGATTALSSIDVSAGNGIELSGNVTTANEQTYRAAVKQSQAANFTAGGNVRFDSTLDGAGSLAVSTTGIAGFAAAIGSVTSPASLNISANNGITLGGNITTQGAQNYQGNLLLTSDVAMTSQAGGNITLNSAVNGAYQFLVDTNGALTLASAGLQAALTNIDVRAANGILLNGSVTTQGTQIYRQNIQLGSSVNLTTANNAIQMLGDVQNASGLRGLTIDAGNAAVSVGGTLGSSDALQGGALGNVVVNGTGNVFVNDVYATSFISNTGTLALKGNVTTNNDQHYRGNVDLKKDVSLLTTGGGNVAFAALLNGAYKLTVATGQTAAFAGAIGGVSALKALDVTATNGIRLGANVSTEGDQLYKGPVTLTHDVQLNSLVSGKVDFANTVDGAYELLIDSIGATRFAANVGATDALTALTVTADDGILLQGNITTTGSQIYNDAITLKGDIALVTTAGDVQFKDAIDNEIVTPAKLAVRAQQGQINFDGIVGGANGKLESIRARANSMNVNAGVSLRALDLIELSADNHFTNSSGLGSDALQMGVGGRWLIWGTDPAALSLNGLTYDFKQYNATFGSSTVLGTGKGVLYSLAPTLTIALDVAQKPIFGSNVNLLTSDFVVTGMQPNDIITAVSATNAVFNNHGMGNSFVDATGLSVVAKEQTTGARVYGYQHNNTVTGVVNIVLPPPLPTGSLGLMTTLLEGSPTDVHGRDLAASESQDPQLNIVEVGVGL